MGTLVRCSCVYPGSGFSRLRLAGGLRPAIAQGQPTDQRNQQPGLEQSTQVPDSDTSVLAMSLNVELIGQIGGVSNGVAISGTYAYLGVGPRLAVLDITNPLTPTIIGQSDVLTKTVQRVAVSGNLAFVSSDLYLRVIDVSNPAAPNLAAVVPISARGEISDVKASGSFAYVTCQEGPYSDGAGRDIPIPELIGHDEPRQFGAFFCL